MPWAMAWKSMPTNRPAMARGGAWSGHEHGDAQKRCGGVAWRRLTRAGDELVGKHTEGPHVDAAAVRRPLVVGDVDAQWGLGIGGAPGEDELRGHGALGADEGDGRARALGGEGEVRHKHASARIDQDVLPLDVPVDDAARVDVAHGGEDGPHHVARHDALVLVQIARPLGQAAVAGHGHEDAELRAVHEHRPHRGDVRVHCGQGEAHAARGHRRNLRRRRVAALRPWAPHRGPYAGGSRTRDAQ